MDLDPFDYIDVAPSLLASRLPPLFVRLARQDEDPSFLYKYARAFKIRISDSVMEKRFTKYDYLSVISLRCGLLRAFMSMVQLDALDNERSSASYHAGDAIASLIMTGDISERAALLTDLLEYDIVTILLNKVGHPLCTQRQLAASWMRALTSETPLIHAIGPQRSGDIMEKFCQYTLDGPDLYIQQLPSPEFSWQCDIVISRDLTPVQARKYAPRYFSLTQENSMWLIHGMLCRDPLVTHRFRLDILKHKPQVVDLLAECGALKAKPWYPENECDAIACEALALLFLPSLDAVPGIPIPLTDSLQEEDDAELEAFNESLEILFSRRWVELLVKIWKRLDDERWQDTLQFFKRVAHDHFAVDPPNETSFNTTFEYHGTSRICVLRIIATATHASDTSLISDADLFPLLRVAHLGCKKAQSVKPSHLSSPNPGPDLYATIEVDQEIIREPLYAKSLPIVAEPTEVIPPMPVMAPIAFFRILTLLAQRGLLEKITSWTRLPDGTSTSVTLREVQQIINPSNVEKWLKFAMAAVVSRRERGTDRMRSGDINPAMATYITAAELAAVLLAFHEATQGKWASQLSSAREEVVKSLGNASEMAFKLRKYRRALRFAIGAVSVGEGAPASNPINSSLIAKNKRRIEVISAQVKP
ncbi:hypothetical protein ONZ45_g15938 [Pleurotus djamor]|nr:hypothetical protein ONZ45_g15938 [Pleurotus djamor]